MRLAGTCSKYSKSAMPQLTSAAMYHGRPDKFRRCAYHAKVMKTLEAASPRTVSRTLVGMLCDSMRATSGSQSVWRARRKAFQRRDRRDRRDDVRATERTESTD